MSHDKKLNDKSIRIRSGTPQGRSSFQRSRSPMIEQNISFAINLQSKLDLQNNPKDLERTLFHNSLPKSHSQSKLIFNSLSNSKSPESFFTTTISEIEQMSSDCTTPSTKSTIEKNLDIYALESKINYQMQKLGEECVISLDKFKIYNKMWEELITIENPYSKVLRQIKNGYDEWINFLDKEMKAKSQKIEIINGKLKEATHTLKLLKKRFKKLAVENMELNSNLSDKNKENCYFQEKIESLKLQLKNEKLNGKESLKSLRNDNHTLKDLLKESNDYAKELKGRLKLFRELVNAVKSNGYPVEDIYNQIMKSKAHKQENSIDLKISFSNQSFLNQLPNNEADHLSTVDFIYSPSVDCSDVGEIFTYKEFNEDSVFNALSEIRDV
ncbi:unnamed protein product [Blepharisma stoltei]|uniref:Uncharacterized protein n=1 Tax=Blepharisma stoltei TaxID=1481888 RepID=A0AAU9K2W5_9CILI|nr:unnamed protein product [Blepharisma stoltei]